MSDVKGMYIGGSPTYFKDETAREFISDIYDETKTYAVDSYCIHENKLYKCTTETTGGFDGSCWKETNMTDELSEQNKKIGVVGDLQNISNNFPYVVPQDGFLYISIIPEVSTTESLLYISGLFGGATNARILAVNGGSATGFYICKKDDVLQITNQTNIRSYYIGFIPLA